MGKFFICINVLLLFTYSSYTVTASNVDSKYASAALMRYSFNPKPPINPIVSLPANTVELIQTTNLDRLIPVLFPVSIDTRGTSSTFAPITPDRLLVIQRGEARAQERYNNYRQTLNTQAQSSLRSNIASGIAYAAASVIATQLFATCTELIKRTLLYNNDVLRKKNELLSIKRELAIHNDNIKTLTAREPLVNDNKELALSLKQLITQELSDDLDARKRLATCEQEYKKLKEEKLKKKN